jgi:hypothetical protein
MAGPGEAILISGSVSGGFLAPQRPHPPARTVMGMTECEALPAPAWEGCPGAEAARGSKETIVHSHLPKMLFS